MIKVYTITPVPKPRQSPKDKWKPRPAVQRYRAFADECRLKKVYVPQSGAKVTFFLPMPKGWSKSKRREMAGQPHQRKSGPDVDNLLKALLDALYGNDSCVWSVRSEKRWGVQGQIVVEY